MPKGRMGARSWGADVDGGGWGVGRGVWGRARGANRAVTLSHWLVEEVAHELGNAVGDVVYRLAVLAQMRPALVRDLVHFLAFRSRHHPGVPQVFEQL